MTPYKSLIFSKLLRGPIEYWLCKTRNKIINAFNTHLPFKVAYLLLIPNEYDSV